MQLSGVTRAVVTVGEGCGFIIEGPRTRLIVTAAHCLPRSLRSAQTSSRTPPYKNLIGELGTEPKISGACLFVDSVADLAVLGAPEDQAFATEAAGFDALVNAGTALPIADAPSAGEAWILGLDGAWFGCRAQHYGGPLWLSELSEVIVPGLSGSPILDNRGSAIGAVSAPGGSGDIMTRTDSGPNPRLKRSLPGWLLRRRTSEI